MQNQEYRLACRFDCSHSRHHSSLSKNIFCVREVNVEVNCSFAKALFEDP